MKMNFFKNFISTKENNYKSGVPPGAGSQFEIDTWEISRFILNELVPVVGIKPYPLNELVFMAASICWSRPSLLFEWGTHVGKSARIFHETCKAFNISTKIHSIDLPPEIGHREHPKSRRGIFVKDFPSVDLYLGDGLEISIDIAKKIGSDKKIFFYLDGDHHYKSVKRELKVILEAIPTATILLHDTFYRGGEVEYEGGPSKAVNEILLDQRYLDFKKKETDLGVPGMILLYK